MTKITTSTVKVQPQVLPVKLGDVFQWNEDGALYMICRLDMHRIALINLETGNRFSDAVPCTSAADLTKEDTDKVFNYRFGGFLRVKELQIKAII